MRVVSVGFDIDDVIFPWYEVAHRICVEAGLCDKGVTPTTWHPYEEYGVDKQAWIDLMNEACLSGALYQAEPFPDVVEPMHVLAGNLPGYDFHIKLVTARGFWAHGETVRAHTYAQLRKHKIPGWVTFSQDKTAVRTDYFIDDNIHNYDALAAAGTKAFLQERPWNAGKDDRRRVKTVKQYVDAIIKELTDK